MMLIGLSGVQNTVVGLLAIGTTNTDTSIVIRIATRAALFLSGVREGTTMVATEVSQWWSGMNGIGLCSLDRVGTIKEAARSS